MLNILTFKSINVYTQNVKSPVEPLLPPASATLIVDLPPSLTKHIIINYYTTAIPVLHLTHSSHLHTHQNPKQHVQPLLPTHFTNELVTLPTHTQHP